MKKTASKQKHGQSPAEFRKTIRLLESRLKEAIENYKRNADRVSQEMDAAKSLREEVRRLSQELERRDVTIARLELQSAKNNAVAEVLERIIQDSLKAD